MSKRKKPGWQDNDEFPMHMSYNETVESQKYINKIVIGQRWISKMEPELGIGTVTQVDHRRITISFHGGSLLRQYAIDTAPLRRVIFQKGDTIRIRDNHNLIVKSLVENEGLIIYKTDTGDIEENKICDTVTLTTPLDRLLGGHTDSISDFNLRYAILKLRNEINRSPVRGWTGGRIELIPHQLYIAKQVTSRHIRRFLLADEVGLGKTIEACLILHNLMVKRQANRTLILLPESLIHIWFVELLRKFNTLFKIFDKEFLKSFQMDNNPFLSESLILSDINFIANSKQLQQYAIEAGWDLLIIDEAHHIFENSVLYPFVEILSGKTRDMLLLTATPQQFGEKNHFLHLKLLDHSRYENFEGFKKESQGYGRIAALTGRLLEKKTLNEQEKTFLFSLLPQTRKAAKSKITPAEDVSVTNDQTVNQLIDRYGTGRVMFRNTRSSVGGFPQRTVNVIPLQVAPEIRHEYNESYKKFLKQIENPIDMKVDPRIEFIVKLLKMHKKDKFLLISASSDVQKIDKAIQKEIRVKTAVFHEGLTLIQRDRNAAYFAEDDGARILICSEIGSEGRNFQFLHHLILFDLPANPELIEQRIGRLDRIGQKGPIIIHVPFINGTAHEVLARIFHEGMGIFNNIVHSAQEVFEKYKSRIHEFVTEEYSDYQKFEIELNSLIQKIVNEVSIVSKRLHSGRDRLLEQYSFKPDEGKELVNQIKKFERNINFVNVIKDLLRKRGIYIEEITDKIYKLWSEGDLDDHLPGIRNSRPVITFDRTTALHREDIEFFTPDHPAVLEGIDLFLGSETGNSSLAFWPSDQTPALFLETVYVIECIAPPQLNTSRFLPPVPVRVVVDQLLKDRTKEIPPGLKVLQECGNLSVLDNDDIKNRLIPDMEQRSAEIAESKMEDIIHDAIKKMDMIAGSEVTRLIVLREKNRSISEDEINAAKEELVRLKTALKEASAHLDSLRIIWKAPAL